MNIPLLDLKAQFAGIQTDIHAATDEVLESQYFILGPTVENFEKQSQTTQKPNTPLGLLQELMPCYCL